ncbi:MAG: UvrD-helicase domain-containing protein [Bacteroidetes bacterium]|nr:UvrD-helicase domain-containing protein [Bacteroidota bacterium]
MNLNTLNSAQRNAVIETEGPVLVVAGAGSGKTMVLTYRIAYLISNGVDPANILALTFTNKAAEEMKERIRHLIGKKADRLSMGTFHSVFAKLLRFEASHINFTSSYSIYDTDDSLRVIKGIMNDFDISDNFLNPKFVQSRISNAKNKLIKPEYYENNFFGIHESKIKTIYEEYRKRLKSNNSMDFDDLLIKPIELFEKDNGALLKYQKRYKYILVDEYQDTNHAQYRMLKLLSSGFENICVVGDDAQSIYKWRGADIRNILDFTKDFSSSKIIRLEQNYRSTKSILSVADSIIKRNVHQIEKNLWTDNEEGNKVTVYECLDDKDEANHICKAITIKMMSQEFKASDFAILYRTNAQSRIFEEALIKSTIPYVVVGGTEFYKRKEIKDVIAYLRLLVNPDDNESLLRIVNFPSRGIGEVSLEALKKLSQQNEISLLKGIQALNNSDSVTERVKKNFINFFNLVMKYSELVGKLNVNELVRSLIDETGILKMYKEEGSEDSINRYENISQLLNGLQDFVNSNPTKTLVDFLNDIALISEIDKWEDKSTAVALMTLHSAKGLEFKNVFVVGCEDGLLPLSRDSSVDDVEEERRLFYVGCTRAKKNLYVSFARNRNRFGNLYPQRRSRFLDEIDERFVEHESTSFSHAVSFRKKASYTQKKDFSKSRNAMPKYEDFSQEEKVLTVGTRVMHDVFGEGTIRQLSGFGDNLKAVVEFDEGLRKHLMLKFAKLKVL